MAIYLLGPSFVATNEIDGTTKTYQPYYDSGTGDVFYTALPSTGVDVAGVSALVRGYDFGDQVTIFCIGTTRVIGRALLNDPWAYVELTENSSYCAYVPPSDVCDLIINSLSTTDETSIGANDGTLTVNASSSHTPIEYSLDNSTWQSSNLFTGIAPNNYTIYLRDAKSGCLAQQVFTINAYVVPVKNFTDDLPVVVIGANASRWSAAFNPIYITYQRKDFQIDSVLMQNTNQVKVTLQTQLSSDQIGQALSAKNYVKTSLYSIYDIAVSHSIVAGFSVLIFNQLYLADDTGGFLNIGLYKSGYQVQTEITFGDSAYNRKVIVASHSPDYTGQTRADISGFLRTQLSAKDSFNYVDASYKDANLGQSYTIRFREAWASSQSQWYVAPYPLYFTYAAMQLGEQYGGNMAQYVPFLTTVSPSQKAKFLTDWQQPIMWSGLPFELSFIYSENVIDKQLYIELIPDCGSPTNNLLINADAGLITNVDASRFIISQAYNPSISGFAVIQALGVTRVLIPDIFDCCAQNIITNIYYLDGSTKVYVMQNINIKHECPCEDPYIYLKWLNSRGAWDYYRFGFNQSLNASVSNDSSVVRFVENWETSDTIEDTISKSSIKQLVLGANNISEDEATALQYARKSIKAQILVNSNPVKWQTVIIKDGDTDSIQTRRKKSNNVKFTILLPSDNIQTQ